MASVETGQDLIAMAGHEPADATPVAFQGREPAILDDGDGLAAANARRIHDAANLCDGHFDGRNIECPWHWGISDARSAAVLASPLRVLM